MAKKHAETVTTLAYKVSQTGENKTIIDKIGTTLTSELMLEVGNPQKSVNVFLGGLINQLPSIVTMEKVKVEVTVNGTAITLPITPSILKNCKGTGEGQLNFSILRSKLLAAISEVSNDLTTLQEIARLSNVDRKAVVSDNLIELRMRTLTNVKTFQTVKQVTVKASKVGTYLENILAKRNAFAALDKAKTKGEAGKIAAAQLKVDTLNNVDTLVLIG
jgi:hypothetical protein